MTSRERSRAHAGKPTSRLRARTRTRSQRFHGRIAGFGTASGTRIVVGMWESSPLGRFGDVMLEQADGHRILFAPSDDVAQYVSQTYTFDEVRRVPVIWRRIDGGIAVDAGELRIRMRIGGISALGRLLRAVPRAFATHPLWLRLIDPVARVLQPGARTAGSAGNGRREYYGVTDARRITGVSAKRDGTSLGGLARLHPPVRFGFGSAPAAPHLVDVTTTILLPPDHSPTRVAAENPARATRDVAAGNVLSDREDA